MNSVKSRVNFRSVFKISNRTKKKATSVNPTAAIKQRRNTIKSIENKLSKTEKSVNARLAQVKDKLPERAEALTKAEQTQLSVNSKGDKRGLHMRENPPSSDKMKKVRAMRNFYSKAMPKLQCNTCAFSANCPQYKPEYECAFLPMLNAHKVNSLDDIKDYMKELLGSNLQRLHLASMFERLSGAMPSAEISESYAMLFQQLLNLAELEHNTPASVAVKSKDSIIQSLFGNINILVNTTGSHKSQIANALLDVPTEDNQTSLKRQEELLTGKVNTADLELMADFARSRQEDDPKQTIRAIIPSVTASTLKTPA